jgi:hypothetical protein
MTKEEYWSTKGKKEPKSFRMEVCPTCHLSLGTFRKAPGGHYFHVNCPGPRGAH